MTSYPLQKYPIHPRDRTQPHGSKPHYKVSDSYHTDISHGEKDIEFYKDTEESSDKYKEDAKYPE